MTIPELLDDEIESMPADAAALIALDHIPESQLVSLLPLVAPSTHPFATAHQRWYQFACDLLLEAGYRVLAPFTGGARRYVDDAGVAADEGTLRRGLLIDVESTGPDANSDDIIQLAVLPFTYCERRGVILDVQEPYVSLTQSARGIPIHADAFAVHGISDDMVRDCAVDMAVLEPLFANADLLVAHNAAFDATMFSRTYPALAAKIAWACSLVDIPWRQKGYESARLGALLQDHTQHHFSGHDAGRDVAATAHVLATPFSDGTTPFGVMLRNALMPRVRVIADGAPFEAKDLLKARGYSWNDHTKPGARLKGVKAWWRECTQADLASERVWLAQHVYHTLMPDQLRIREITLDPATRFTA